MHIYNRQSSETVEGLDNLIPPSTTNWRLTPLQWIPCILQHSLTPGMSSPELYNRRSSLLPWLSGQTVFMLRKPLWQKYSNGKAHCDVCVLLLTVFFEYKKIIIIWAIYIFYFDKLLMRTSRTHPCITNKKTSRYSTVIFGQRHPSPDL